VGQAVENERQVESRLVDALEPFRGFALAAALQAFFETGAFDSVRQAGAVGASISATAADLGLQSHRFRSLCLYLASQGVVSVNGTMVALEARGEEFGEFRAWYELLVGGYGVTFAELSHGLRHAGPLPRSGRHVSAGSAGVSIACSLPMVLELARALPSSPRLILDIGCGSPAYLQRICTELNCRGLGVEPDPGAFADARDYVASLGESCAVEVMHGRAQESPKLNGIEPDVILIAFVLHELLGQDGEVGVVKLLRQLQDRFPTSRFLVIEVDAREADEGLFSHGYVQNYYSAYFLLHHFTQQRLAPRGAWLDLFDSVGLRIVKEATTPSTVDSTGLELGWLLEPAALSAT
jgi:2-ketoarginine methyltransferase